MRISNKGIELIKQFEGCRLKAYKDPAGVPTIGYGHTAGVRMGDSITQEQADELLRDDLVIFEQKVAKYNDKYDWNQNQFDALVSFAYNIGNIDQLTSNGRRNISTISSKIPEYNKAGGKVLQGLVRRREAEKKLFDKEPDNTPEPAPVEEKPVTPEPVEEKKVDNPYTVGKVYTISVKTALNVRKGPGKGFGIVGYANLTTDGKKHANKLGALLNGTKVTCKETKVVGSSIWMKIPSGWICARDENSRVFVK